MSSVSGELQRRAAEATRLRSIENKSKMVDYYENKLCELGRTSRPTSAHVDQAKSYERQISVYKSEIEALERRGPC